MYSPEAFREQSYSSHNFGWLVLREDWESNIGEFAYSNTNSGFLIAPSYLHRSMEKVLATTRLRSCHMGGCVE